MGKEGFPQKEEFSVLSSEVFVLEVLEEEEVEEL